MKKSLFFLLAVAMFSSQLGLAAFAQSRVEHTLNPGSKAVSIDSFGRGGGRTGAAATTGGTASATGPRRVVRIHPPASRLFATGQQILAARPISALTQAIRPPARSLVPFSLAAKRLTPEQVLVSRIPRSRPS